MASQPSKSGCCGPPDHDHAAVLRPEGGLCACLLAMVRAVQGALSLLCGDGMCAVVDLVHRSYAVGPADVRLRACADAAVEWRAAPASARVGSGRTGSIGFCLQGVSTVPAALALWLRCCLSGPPSYWSATFIDLAVPSYPFKGSSLLLCACLFSLLLFSFDLLLSKVRAAASRRSAALAAALWMSAQPTQRVRRVRLARQRRTDNLLGRGPVLSLENTQLNTLPSSNIGPSRRARSLMDFAPELAKTNRKRRCLVRSRLPPLPPTSMGNSLSLNVYCCC
uniref:Uncharacterized protein n=1 Tax=Leersia perrieri TaxID=77586 RepID=A0A0D9V8Q4_9ORYZ